MAHYTTNRLDKNSEIFLTELDFRVCQSCSSTSVWRHYCLGIELYIPTNTHFKETSDVLQLIWETGFKLGYADGKKAVITKLYTKLDKVTKRC